MSFRLRECVTVCLLLIAACGARASDEVVVDLPNPFGVGCIKEERIGANWRHGLHRMREKFTDYFKVYDEELEGGEPTTLEKVKENPAYYLDRKIEFDVHLGKTGHFYKPGNSPFGEDGYVNFGVWPYGVELWRPEVRGDVSLLFYLDKKRKNEIEQVSHTPMYTPMHVWGIVRSKNDNTPWLEIKGLEIIKETPLTDSSLRHLEGAVSQMRQKRFDVAAQLFDQGLALQLPVFAEARVYANLGRCDYELRLFRSSRNALVNAILRDSKVVLNLILLARDDLRVDPEDGNFAAEAREAAERAIALEPTNPEAHAELGLALAMLGDIRGGYREVDNAQKFASGGKLPEANRNRAMIALLEKNFDLATRELNQAVVLRPTDYTIHLELGDVNLITGKLEEARREYTQAKELAPQRAEPFYKTALALKLQGEAFEKEGKKVEAEKAYDEAIDNVTSAIAKDIHMSRAYGLKAELLRKRGHEEEAKKVLEQGALNNPRSPRMQDVYYEQAAALHDWEGMEKATRAALAFRRDAVHLSRMGKILSGRPNPDFNAAAEALTAAVGMNPTSGDDWALLGQIRLNQLGETTGAASALQEAVRLQPGNGVAWFTLAQVDRALGDTAAEVSAAGQAADILKSDDAKLLQAQALADRGAAEDTAKAVEIAQGIEAATKVDADKAHAQSVRAAALVKQGKLDDALEAVTASDAVLKSDPQNSLIHGQILLARGDISGAREFFNSALSLTQNAEAANLGVRADAQRGLSQTVITDKKGVIIVRGNTEMRTTDGEAATNKRPMPPVTEEGNGSTEPVPAQVPGPR